MCSTSSQPNQIQKCGLQDHNKSKNEICYVYICSESLFLCREHLQCLCCQIDEDVFFICRCFFICSTLSSLGHRTLYIFKSVLYSSDDWILSLQHYIILQESFYYVDFVLKYFLQPVMQFLNLICLGKNLTDTKPWNCDIVTSQILAD